MRRGTLRTPGKGISGKGVCQENVTPSIRAALRCQILPRLEKGRPKDMIKVCVPGANHVETGHERVAVQSEMSERAPVGVESIWSQDYC